MASSAWTKRKLIKFSILTCFITLLILEIFSRIVFAIQYRRLHTSLFIQGNTIQMSDSTLVFRNRPLYVNKRIGFQYNEEGMKVKPGDVQMPQKKENDFWVFLFGASAMEGMGSNQDGAWLDITGVEDYPPDQTIAAYLQEILQQNMPGKNVRVFNAANSSFTLQQSRLRYQQLTAKYKMDWVISMDGQNEPVSLNFHQTTMKLVQKGWKENPVFHFPLNTLIRLSSHSAFVYELKQLWFNHRRSTRIDNIEDNQHEERAKWSKGNLGPIEVAENKDVDRAIDTFFRQLIVFDSILNSTNQPHKLYVQPHLIYRGFMNDAEKPLMNYYLYSRNDSLANGFFFGLKDRFSQTFAKGSSIEMIIADTLSFPVFVDYCHLTNQANRYLAQKMATDILSKQ